MDEADAYKRRDALIIPGGTVPVVQIHENKVFRPHQNVNKE